MKLSPSVSSSVRNPLRVGIVGVGNWAAYAHIPALKLLPGYRITAVATRRQDSADAWARQHEIPHAFGDYRELVAHPEVDLVVVLTTAPQHEPIVRAAIEAGKDVFCEWPLTPSTSRSLELLNLAEAAGVRHLVGLQRRLAPSFRYLRDLLLDGYVGRVRSARLSVAEPTYYADRSKSIAFTIPSENFTHVASIYGGHFMDALFATVGHAKEFSARLITQFKQVRIIETGELIPTDAPNELLLNGLLSDGAALSVHVEGGKRNGYGMELVITGTEGDLRVSNAVPFHNQDDSRIEGAQGSGKTLEHLPVPSEYHWLPASPLPASALELANVYAAHLLDLKDQGGRSPTFLDAVNLHRLMDAIARKDRCFVSFGCDPE